MRSRQELAHALTAHGLAAADIPRIVRECERRGILDDRAAAILWAGHWARRGYGWPAIRERLSARGFGDAAIEQAGQRVGVSAAEEETRARIWMAAQRQRRRLSRQRSLAGIAQQLIARGFEPELVERLMPIDDE